MSKKTVQIVGSGPETAGDHSLDVPVWSFPGPLSDGYLKRIDLLLEIHDKTYFEQTNAPPPGSDIEPWDWLYHRIQDLRQRDRDFEVLLAEETLFEELGWPPQRGIAPFPLQDLMDFYTLPTRGPEETRCRFFTSSPAYLMALAGYRGFGRVELYGIQGSSSAEFINQREGLGFWAGQLLGRGIDVWVPRTCLLFGTSSNRIYGFGENAMAMGRVELQGYVEQYNQAIVEVKSKMDELHGRYEELILLGSSHPSAPRLPALQEAYDSARELLELYTGAALFGKFLLRRIDGISNEERLPILPSEDNQF